MYVGKTKATYMTLPWCNLLNIDANDSGVLENEDLC